MAANPNPERDPVFRYLVLMIGIATVAVLGFAALDRTATPVRAETVSTTAAVSTTHYTPQVRDLTVTAVPMLVHEQSGFFDYLNKAFAKGGTLHEKEVWAFSPNNLVVYEGDTVDVTVVNPGDDPHTFTISALNFSIDVPGASIAHGSFVVPKRGLYTFFCSIAEHSPYMWGNLTVLPASDAP